MVNFIPLNNTDPESVESLLLHIDNAIQYGEDLEPKVQNDEDPDEDGDGDDDGEYDNGEYYAENQ